MRALIKILAFGTVSTGLIACQSAVSERNFTAEVIQGLSQNGMMYVGRARQNGDLQRVMQEISDGNGLLIDNAYLMRRSLQEHEQLDLQNALTTALQHRPDKVLALMPAHYRYDDLCNVPTSIADEDKQQFIDNAIRSLSAAKHPAKARQQQQCLARFESLNNSAAIKPTEQTQQQKL